MQLQDPTDRSVVTGTLSSCFHVRILGARFSGMAGVARTNCQKANDLARW